MNAIVSLGNSLSLKIVAEGVELDEQRRFFENLKSEGPAAAGLPDLPAGAGRGGRGIHCAAAEAAD